MRSHFLHLWLYLNLPLTSSFLVSRTDVSTTCRRHGLPREFDISYRLTASASSEDTDDTDDSSGHPLSGTSRLSHAMLKVKSVDDAVSYWAQKGGTVLQSRKDDDETYKSAFVTLGNGQTTDNCFALELVKTENCKVGNVLNYIGVSLLLQFQGNLRGLISGQDQAQSEGPEPHGIPIKSCASSPGDFLCRICLKSNDLEKTQHFYEDLLGMKLAAGDESQLCLRYNHKGSSGYGVPTTIVFEGTNEKLDHGTCLDHLAIETTTSINQLFERFQSSSSGDKKEEGVAVYLHPTEMFGKTVMGLRDPNGYKVVLAGPA